MHRSSVVISGHNQGSFKRLRRSWAVRDATLEVLKKNGGEGIMLSLGGGTIPAMPRENMFAMQQVLEEFNSKRVTA